MLKRTLAFTCLATIVLARPTFEYDEKGGWWWYKDIQKQNNTTIEVKEKFSPKEKAQFEQNDKLIELLQTQTQMLQKINERLEYAFPNVTPKYIVNSKGKKCLANSNADCFVMPTIAEAQQVPVLDTWLKDPSPQNSKEWLKWQATYFNHLERIGTGLRFAFLKDGADAYPTSVISPYDESLTMPISQDVAHYRRTENLLQMKDKISFVFFMGGNTLLESNLDIYKTMGQFSKDNWQQMSIAIAVPTDEAKQRLLSHTKPLYDSWQRKFWDNVEIFVAPRLFKSMNVAITPSVALFYKNDNNEISSQVIGVGNMGEIGLAKLAIDYLTYNKIIDPKELNAAYNFAQPQMNMKQKGVEINESNIYKDDK